MGRKEAEGFPGILWMCVCDYPSLLLSKLKKKRVKTTRQAMFLIYKN